MKTKSLIGVPRCLWICRRYMAPDRAERWMESFGSLWPQERLIWTQPVARPRVRIDFYARSEKEARKFSTQHGGRVLSLLAQAWWPTDRADAAPLRFGQKLWVVATAKQADYWRRRHPDKKILVITSGMAFGTGQHETTAMCLQAMLWVAPQLSSRHTSGVCLDIGTGSGILALAAEAMGFKKVLAIDHDATAIRVAREHGKLNKSRIVFTVADITQWKASIKADIVVANLYSEVLVKRAAPIMARLSEGGFLILSGIQKNQAKHVRAAYPSLRFVRMFHKGNWVCLVARER